jgi:hypothetical protein
MRPGFVGRMGRNGGRHWLFVRFLSSPSRSPNTVMARLGRAIHALTFVDAPRPQRGCERTAWITRSSRVMTVARDGGERGKRPALAGGMGRNGGRHWLLDAFFLPLPAPPTPSWPGLTGPSMR